MMIGTERSATRRSLCRVAAPIALVGVLTLAACGGGENEPAAAPPDIQDRPPATSPATTTIATAPPTTATAPTTTTRATPTTLLTTLPAITLAPIVTSPPSTTTTLVVEAEPQPIAPPADEYSQEPVIEVGSIVIPKLDVDMTMYEGIRLTTLDNGPGHWPGSALPGDTGNMVIAGHRTSSHRVFRNVDQLESGDEIIFRDETGEHRYRVNRVEIVEPTAMWIVDPTETATATLFACHPPGSTTQRIVVFADLAESSDA